MANYTSRLGLRKPDYTDSESVIQDVDNNFQTIDDRINANLYTSTTRPIDPYNGQLIYETDTHLLAINIPGSGWVYVGGQAYAKGKMAVVTSDVDSSGASNNEIGPFISVTFTATAGRRYWVETTFSCSFTTGSGNGASCHPRVRWASGASVTTAGTQIGADVLANMVWGPNIPQDFWQLYEFVPNVTGSITVGLFLASLDSTHTTKFDQASDSSAQLFVRDVGM